MTSFVPPLSFLSHLLGWTESPLSRSLGWLLHWSPWRHLFPLCLSLLFSRALPLSGCYFPETLWISYNPFFLPHLFSYFFHLELDANSTPASRPTVRLCVHLSVYLSPRPPSFSQFLSGPKAPWKKKIQEEIEKTIYIAIFKKKKLVFSHS